MPLTLTITMALILSLICCAAPGALAKSFVQNTAGPSDKNYKAGIKAFKKGDYDGAIDAELQAIYFARNGYQPDAYLQLGLAYQAKKNYPKAYEALSKSTSQAMDKANEAHLALSQVCTEMKKYEESTVEVNRAYDGLEWGKGLWGRVKYQQAYNLDMWGQWASACSAYGECMGPKPYRFWYPWIGLAECMMKMKKWVDAYQCLNGMIVTDATIKGLDFERVYLDMGICALAKGNHQSALDNWHKVLEYNPDNKEAHLQLALMLDSEQHFSSAITEYKYFIRMAGEGDEQRVKEVEKRIQMLEQQKGIIDAPPPVQAIPIRRPPPPPPQPIGEPGF